MSEPFMPPEWAERVLKIAAVMPISTELLYPSPATPEERAERARRRLERYHVGRAALTALDELDGLAAALLMLHAPDAPDGSYRRCEGCDFDGCDGEPPEWPCRTVEAIAAHHEIPMPDGFWVWDDPTKEPA